MKYLKKIETENDRYLVDSIPNLVLVNSNKKVLYNIEPNNVFIQHINGTLYTVEEWTTKGFANDQANGIAVCTADAQFVVAKEDITNGIDGSMKWSSPQGLIDGIMTTDKKDTAKSDFVGKSNTEKMLSIDTEGAGYSCANYVFPNGKKGYLPSVGEWLVARSFNDKVNAAAKLIGGHIMYNTTYWASTQYNAGHAWAVNSSSYVDYYTKGDGYNVRAFTTL